MINKSILNIPVSPTLEINELCKKKRLSGEHVVHLGFGESPFPLHKNIIDMTIENVENKEYLPCQGLDTLRVNISKYFKSKQSVSFHADDIIIGPGSKELLFDVQLIMDAPLVIPAGSWVSLPSSITNTK